MSLNIYNTLTRAKEKFESLEPGKVKMYMFYHCIRLYSYRQCTSADFFRCGETFFGSIGYEVTYVVNFTDVDDKLIKKAEEMGVTVPEVARTFHSKLIMKTRGLGVAGSNAFIRVLRRICRDYRLSSGAGR